MTGSTALHRSFRAVLRAVSHASASWAVAGLCALATASPSPSPAKAEPTVGQAPLIVIGANESAASRRVDLTKGRSLIVDLPRDAKEVFVANPAVANAVVRSTRKVFIIGIENGATSIFVMDADGQQIAALDVTVARDINVLRHTLNQSIPTGRFEVRAAGDSLVMTGTVPSASESQQAVDIANGFVGVSAGMRGAVINNLTIREKDQVMLRVTVVEVARSVLKQFGINTSGGWSALNPLGSVQDGLTGKPFLSNTLPFPINAGNTPSNNFLTASVQGAGFSLQATLKAFEQAGVSRILAEPTLTAISGEAAKFMAGGEIPVPASAVCGGSVICSPGIVYKPYGISLTFTPIVLAENRISVRVGTDVTEIDQQNSFNYAVNNQAVAVPGTKVRKSETTVELASGATMMTAGLIQQVSKQAITGLPGLVNLPILGALFRSRDYQRQETELMILVTPFIAKPMQAAKVSRPDDGFVDASDAQAILFGQINRIYGRAGGSPIGRAYRGNAGFIAD